MDISLYLCGHVFNSLGYIPRGGIVRSNDNSIFNIFKNYQTVFQKWLYQKKKKSGYTSCKRSHGYEMNSMGNIVSVIALYGDRS